MSRSSYAHGTVRHVRAPLGPAIDIARVTDADRQNLSGERDARDHAAGRRSVRVSEGLYVINDPLDRARRVDAGKQLPRDPDP